VYGHPEKLKPNKKNWNTDNFGNFIADLGAEGEWIKLSDTIRDYGLATFQYKDIVVNIFLLRNKRKEILTTYFSLIMNSGSTMGI
jgi:hypothetical protein